MPSRDNGELGKVVWVKFDINLKRRAKSDKLGKLG